MSMLKYPPIIITVAPNGARKTKDEHPHLPITPEEIASEAHHCQREGASMLHLHVRNEDQSHCLNINRYKSAIKAVRDAVGDKMIIQVTTEACGIYTPDEQMKVVNSLMPDSVSIAIKEILPDESYEAKVQPFLENLIKENVQPQYILYSAEEVMRFAKLVERGIIPAEKHVVLFVLGRYSKGLISDPFDLLPFIASLHESGRQQHTSWSVCAFGKREASCTLTAAMLGGHVRIGFENNQHLLDGSIAQSNAELIKQFVSFSRVSGRDIANVETARNHMCLR